MVEKRGVQHREQLVTNNEDEILYYNDQYVHFATFKFQKSACSSKAHNGISRNSLRMSRFYKYTPQRPRAAFEIRVHRKIYTT